MTTRMNAGLGLVALVIFVSGCASSARSERLEAMTLTNGGDADAGKVAIRRYGCYACHTIPGVVGARGLVGPDLRGIRERAYIAGQLPNTAENLENWIRHPHQFQPKTVMPEMNVTEEDSRNIAAYLYTLH